MRWLKEVNTRIATRVRNEATISHESMFSKEDITCASPDASNKSNQIWHDIR